MAEVEEVEEVEEDGEEGADGEFDDGVPDFFKISKIERIEQM